MSQLPKYSRSISSGLRRWVAPVADDDTVKARTGALISTLLLISAVLWSSSVTLMLLFNTGNRANISLALAGSAVLLLVRELVRRGRITLATILGVATVWAVITAFHYNLGTPYSVHLFGYLMLVIVAAWLSGAGGGIAASVLSVASIYVLARAEAAGQLPPAVRMQPLNLALNMVAYLGASYGLFFLARNLALRSLGEAQVEIARRKEAESQLSDLNATLEQQVAKRADDLRISEERYRTLLALSPDGITVVDNTGRILFCNEHFARACGLAGAEDLLGRYAAEFAPPGAYETLFGAAAAVLQRGHDVARDIQGAVLSRSGTVVDLEYSISRVPWPTAPLGQAFLCIARDVTKRKADHAELERYRDRLEAMVEARTVELQRTTESLAAAERIAHVGSWEWDLQTGERHWSDEARAIFGVDPDGPEMTRTNMWKAVVEADYDAVAAAYSRALATGETFDMIYRITRPSGERRTVRGRAEMVQDAAGRTVLVQGMVQDVTEHEQAKDTLRQRAEQASALLALGHRVSLSLSFEDVVGAYLANIVAHDAIDMAQLLLVREGRLQLAGIRPSLTGADERMRRLLPDECLCGLALSQGQAVYSGDLDRDTRCIFTHCREMGMRSLAALPLRNADEIIGVLSVGAVKQDAFAEMLDFLGIAADLVAVRVHNALLHQEIRERAAGLEEIVAERTHELQAERDRTHAVLETVGESVVVTDCDGQVLFANPATEVLTGYSREECLARPLWQGWRAHSLADSVPAIASALAAGAGWRGEVAGARRNGQPYWAMLTGTPLFDAGSPAVPVGGVWVARDITEVREAARLKDQFVSNVSHELRTPISIISLNCDNLERFGDRLDTDKHRQILRDIHEQTHVLQSLVDNVLLSFRIEGGHVVVPETPVDLDGVLREEVERQRPVARQRSQQLTIASESSIAVRGSEVSLRQIVRNLVDNAMKYTPEGGRIHCVCERRVGAQGADRGGKPGATGTWAVIEVTDSGRGISERDLPFLFERFYRVSAEGDVPGTGLGLPIVRELVELHGGRVEVASAPGRGSTFTVYLPLFEEGRVEG